MMIQAFIPHAWSQNFKNIMMDWGIIIMGFTFVLGLSSILKLHIKKIKQKSENYWLSWVVIISLAITIVIGVFGGAFEPTFITKKIFYTERSGEYEVKEKDTITGKKRMANFPDDYEAIKDENYPVTVRNARSGEKLEVQEDYEINFVKNYVEILNEDVDTIRANYYYRPVKQKTVLMMIYTYAQIPMQATMFSLLAFFIASASFRAFRARNLEAGLLLVTAFVVMLGRVPIGSYITESMPAIVEWIMMYPNLAAQRGIRIGVGLGAIATALKIVLGIEKKWLGGAG